MKWIIPTAVIISGLAIGLFVQWSSAGKPPVVLEPAQVQYGRDALESETIKFHTVLRNRGRTRAVLKEVRVSCGCSEVMTGGNRPLKQSLPMTLEPGSSLPLEMQVVTRGRMGNVASVAVFSLREGSRAYDVKFDVQFNVRGGWRTEPEQILIQGERDAEGQSIAIWDAFPDPGIPISEIYNSDPAGIKIESHPVPDSTLDRSAAYDKPKNYMRDNHFKRRYIVTVRVNKAKLENPFEEYFMVKSDRFADELRVPVVYAPSKPPFEFRPQSISIPLDVSWRAGRAVEVTRRLFYSFSRPEYSSPKLLKSPAYVRVEIGPAEDGMRQIDIHCSIPPGSEITSREVVFEVGKGEKLEIPVIIYEK